MNASAALLPQGKRSRPAAAILCAGLVSGSLDITAALVVYGLFGLRPILLLQGIAAGLLGPQRALAGGLPTAALGLACQYFIAFSASAVYVAASDVIGFLLKHAVISGVLYGIAVYFFMNRIVVPLSAARKYPFSWEMMLVGVTIHIFCVGLPIALLACKFSA
ncbi:MAG TPA: hypothetical protein VGS78_06340 [Candidatus Sulfotelmatobacter sp.]|nr:hypothetical protein [Candidatus Sulfotelmatobacter sp.]